MIAAKSIRENMEVLGSDGVHVGVVDHVEGNNEVRLVNEDAGSEHHSIPLAWVIHVEMKVHLNQPGEIAKAHWTAH